MVSFQIRCRNIPFRDSSPQSVLVVSTEYPVSKLSKDEFVKTRADHQPALLANQYGKSARFSLCDSGMAIISSLTKNSIAPTNSLSEISSLTHHIDTVFNQFGELKSSANTLFVINTSGISRKIDRINLLNII